MTPEINPELNRPGQEFSPEQQPQNAEERQYSQSANEPGELRHADQNPEKPAQATGVAQADFQIANPENKDASHAELNTMLANTPKSRQELRDVLKKAGAFEAAQEVFGEMQE